MSESYQALDENGVFHQLYEGFVPRIAQCEMAQKVEENLTNHGQLIAESGTGTGKTFAYLVPVILTGKRCIISTATKHLQDQIYHRDLPVVSEALNIPVNTVLLKGRSNYLCRYRLKLNSGQSDLVGGASKVSFNIVERWAATTRSGDIAEVTEISEQAPVWQEVTSTADNCLGGKCPDYKKCFVVKARQQALDADVVVVNHHLFFSDLGLKQEGFGELLPHYEAVVFDEAHSLFETASRFFGFSLSSFQISDLLGDILTSEKEEKSGVDFQPGVESVQSALSELNKVFSKIRFQSVNWDEGLRNRASAPIEDLQNCLMGLEASLSSAAGVGDGLYRCHERLMEMQSKLLEWTENRNSDLICWLSISGKGFRLNATPLSVSNKFQSVMEAHDAAWIFTSATLTVAGSFDSFVRQLGMEDAETAIWDSPYDYQNNTLLYLPNNLPDPRNGSFPDALSDLILRIVNISKGRAFCLFTSHAMLQSVAEKIQGHIRWPLLVQGEAPKADLINRFVEFGNAVLLGTSSFWEGVDIKGGALSCVIIDKLPFASPGDPVLKSRLQTYEESGGNAFLDIQVSSAVIALKQGAGRLIRSEDDSGVLVICDSRVTSTRYGKLFLDSLPQMKESHTLDDVENFYQRNP